MSYQRNQLQPPRKVRIVCSIYGILTRRHLETSRGYGTHDIDYNGEVASMMASGIDDGFGNNLLNEDPNTAAPLKPLRLELLLWLQSLTSKSLKPRYHTQYHIPVTYTKRACSSMSVALVLNYKICLFHSPKQVHSTRNPRDNSSIHSYLVAIAIDHVYCNLLT